MFSSAFPTVLKNLIYLSYILRDYDLVHMSGECLVCSMCRFEHIITLVEPIRNRQIINSEIVLNTTHPTDTSQVAIVTEHRQSKFNPSE